MDFDESQTRALLRRRLSALHLPPHFVQQRIDTYIEVVLELIERVEELYYLMDETDPQREELLAGCASQLEAWADTIVEDDVKDTRDTSTTPSSASTHSLTRGRRPLLEEYFKVNAYPSTADKRALAQHEGVSYKQIHVWFQNRRRRAKATNTPLRKQDASSPTSSPTFSQAQRAAAAYESSPPDSLDDMWDDFEPFEFEASQEPEARCPTFSPAASHYDAQTASKSAPRRPRHQPTEADIDDLVSAFDALNVRDVGFRPLPHAPLGYAARDSVTYFAPKAPLSSFVPHDMVAYAPPMTALSPLGHARKLAGIPKRQPASTRRLASVSSDSTSSLSDSSDRVPSLTFSDSSDSSSSSSSPSPESPICSELPPSPPSAAWVDLPSPSFPIVVTPPSLISHDSPSSLSWREDAGAEGDDEDDSWGRSANSALLARSKPRRKTSKQKTARPHSRQSCSQFARNPAPDSQPTLSIASDDVAFNGVTTAVVQDGVEELPNWDELDLSTLDVDPATAGELDIQLGTWDSSNATLPASQFDFGPVATFGDAPSAPVVEVQSEPEREQTVDESPASTDLDCIPWGSHLASGWNDTSSLVTIDNLGFSADFAPSAFDGFIASNWNLEPAQEPSSTPSTLFGKPGFEASNVASTTQSATDVTASKPTNPSTLGATVPETTFTFGSESTQPTFKFGASTSTASAAATPTPAPTSSSSALQSAVPSTTFTFGKPAATQRSTSKAPSSSTFTFGAQSTATPTFAFSSTPSTFRSSPPSVSSSSFSCAPSSFAFGTGLPGPFTFGISA